MVKVAEAAFELESVIVTVLAPAVVDGVVKVVPENEPVALVVVVPLSVTPDPAKVAVNVFEAAKPEPETVSVVPDEPVVGLRVMDGVTVNVAETVLVPSVAWTTWPPATEDGTFKDTPEGIAPEPVDVGVATILPSYFIVSAEFGK